MAIPKQFSLKQIRMFRLECAGFGRKKGLAAIPFRTKYPTPEEIREWSADFGNMGIAAVTDKLSNLFVIDADTPAAVAKIESLLPEQYKVSSATTPKDGRHFYFQHAPRFENWVRPRQGLDIRTEKGIILLPPSRTKATPDGKWVDGEYHRHNDDDIKDRPPFAFKRDKNDRTSNSA